MDSKTKSEDLCNPTRVCVPLPTFNIIYGRGFCLCRRLIHVALIPLKKKKEKKVVMFLLHTVPQFWLCIRSGSYPISCLIRLYTTRIVESQKAF